MNLNLKKICEAWGLGKPISTEAVAEGVLNQNYILTASEGVFFIKCVRPKKQKELIIIAAVESYMYEAGIPAIRMLKTTGGNISFQDHETIVTVYPYVPSDRSHVYSLEEHEKMGEMLAKIQERGSTEEARTLTQNTLEKILSKKSLITLELKKYKEIITCKKIKNSIDNAFLEYINLKLNGISKYTFPDILPNNLLMHGDYHTGNILFDPITRNIVGVCDWEKTKFGPRSYELIRAILYSCIQNTTPLYATTIKSEILEKVQSFLVGYMNISNITLEEIMLGYDATVYYQFLATWMEKLYYEQNNSRANHLIEHQISQIHATYNTDLRKQIQGIVAGLLKTKS